MHRRHINVINKIIAFSIDNYYFTMFLENENSDFLYSSLEIITTNMMRIKNHYFCEKLNKQIFNLVIFILCTACTSTQAELKHCKY